LLELVVGEKDRRVGVGEELLLHLAESPKANRRNQDQRDHNQPAPLQGLPKGVAIRRNSKPEYASSSPAVPTLKK
jgi:hypothetical protein